MKGGALRIPAQENSDDDGEKKKTITLAPTSLSATPMRFKNVT